MHACGVDDTAPPSHRNRLSAPAARMMTLHLRALISIPTLFLLRVTLTEHWWITSHEHRSIVDDAVENAVRQRGIADLFVPLRYRQL